MATRMQKYYKSERVVSHDNSRSNRNKDLYGEIYSNSKYSNIEGIATIDNANEVDITKVKELLKNRENYQKERQYRRVTGDYQNPERIKPTVNRTLFNDEDQNYDIRDVLKEAKEHKEPDNKERVLRNTQYNILKNLDLREELRKEDYEKDDDEELKELIQTITNTSVLNQLDDSELAEDLFSDLHDDDTKIGEIKDVKALIEAEEKKEEIIDPNEPTSYDRSFFTSSLKLNRFDFEGSGRRKSIISLIIIIVLVIIIVVSSILLIMRML